MKKLKFLAFALAASALVLTTSCNDDENGGAPPPPPPAPDWEAAPALDPPPAGYFRLAIATPPGTCDRVILVGDAFGWTDNPGPDQAEFERVPGTRTWFKIDIPADAEGYFKPMALNETGAGNWDWQWGRNNVEGQDPAVFFYPGSTPAGRIISAGDEGATNTDTDMYLYEGDDNDGAIAFVVILRYRTGAPCVPPPPVYPEEDWTVQIHGNAVYPGGEWIQATAEFTSSPQAGTYVFTIPSVQLVGGYMFGMRIQVDGSQWNDGERNWWSFGTAPVAVTITGDYDNFSGDANIVVGETRTYAPVTITIERDTEAQGPITSFTMNFPVPAP